MTVAQCTPKKPVPRHLQRPPSQKRTGTVGRRGHGVNCQISRLRADSSLQLLERKIKWPRDVATILVKIYFLSFNVISFPLHYQRGEKNPHKIPRRALLHACHSRVSAKPINTSWMLSPCYVNVMLINAIKITFRRC